MSNPNTSALSMANRQRHQLGSDSTASNLKVVYIGKDKQPVTIIPMVSINGQAWKKSACFESLRNIVYSLADSHSVAEVTSLVSNELPLDTGSAFQASQSAAKFIMDGIMQVGFLEPIAFMTSTAKVVQIGDPDDLLQRPEDITFLQMLCTIDGESQDKRVTTADTLSFQFCLRLPQHELDVASKAFKLVSSPVHQSPAGVSRSLGSCFSAATTGGTTTGPSTPTGSTTSGTSFTSPAMKLFLSTGSDPSKTRKGFYGPFTFLDTQSDFDATFGKNPRVLPMIPTGSDIHDIQNLLREFSDKCRLDIFMHQCMIDYVGNDKVDPTLHVQDVCKQLSLTKQIYTCRGKNIELTPDEMFDRFCALSVSLPENARIWPIQLCSLFLGALGTELADHVTTDDDFSMPDLSTLTTKETQLDALRYVRVRASKSYDYLKKQKDKMSKMMQGMHRGQQYNFQSQCNDGYGDEAYAQSFFQNSTSLAESTISKHSGGIQAATDPNIETRIHPKTGKHHPFYRAGNYISDYPLGFRGCFNCGENDHWKTSRCPLALSGNFNKNRFFKEMWAHKPHTKNAQRDSQYSRGGTNNLHNPNTGAHNHGANTAQHNNSYKVENHGQSALSTSTSPSFYNTSGDHNIRDNHGNNNNGHYGPRNVDNTPSWLNKVNVSTGNTTPQVGAEKNSSRKKVVYLLHMVRF